MIEQAALTEETRSKEFSKPDAVTGEDVDTVSGNTKAIIIGKKTTVRARSPNAEPEQ